MKKEIPQIVKESLIKKGISISKACNCEGSAEYPICDNSIKYCNKEE